MKSTTKRLLLGILLTVCLTVLLALCVGAEDVTYSEGLEFTSNGDGTCYVSGIGTCTDTEIVIPPVSPSGDTVTGIGEYAFWYDQWGIGQDSALASITSVTIPDTVTDIGAWAFSDSPLTEVHIPNGVKNIGSSAFLGCANLTYIVLPESVTVIEEDVFAYSALTSIEILGKITKIGARAFSGSALTEISIESNDVVIDFDAFSSCWQLEEISIHGNIREIADRAFAYGSTGNITIYGNIYYVGYKAFYERYSTIHVYGDITFAGGYSFACNDAVYIHGNVGKIGDAAFRDCHLTDLTPFYSATHIDVAAFQDNDFEEIDLRKFENLVFIGGRVFSRNHFLKSVWIPKEFGMQCTLPDGETMLDDDEFNYSWNCLNGMSIFENCTNLENVYLEDGLTFIPDSIFFACVSLEQIDIPNSVTTIGSYAFAWCRIKSVILPENLTTFSAYAFDGCSDELYHTVGKLKFIDDWLVGYIYGDSGEIEDDAQNIIIPEGTKGIACELKFPYAKTVQIPVSLKYINWGVFGYSYELTEVSYWGTKSEWNNIVIDENNDYLLNATIHFLGGECETSITSASLTLGQSLALNYYATLNPAHTAAVMRFTYHGETITVNGVLDETTGEYKFTLGRIPPQCMGDNVKAELILIAEDGTETVLDVKESYSIRQYCDDALAANPENETLATLLADLLAYGDAAQDYANYNEDTPVSEGFEMAPSEWEDVTDTDFTLSDKTREELCFTAAGVRFGYVNRIYFKIKATDLTGVTVTVNGKAYSAEDLEPVENADGTYILYTDAVYATEFDKIFTAELTVDGEVIQTVTYSVKSYVFAKQNGNDDMAALAKALYNYGRSALAYKNAQ